MRISILIIILTRYYVYIFFLSVVFKIYLKHVSYNIFVDLKIINYIIQKIQNIQKEEIQSKSKKLKKILFIKKGLKRGREESGKRSV